MATIATTRASKWGNSIGIRIPLRAAARAGVSSGSAVRVVAEPDKIILTPIRARKGKLDRIPRYSLDELLKGVTPRNLNRDDEWLNAPPIGKEVI